MDEHLPKLRVPSRVFPSVPYYGDDHLIYSVSNLSEPAENRFKTWAAKKAVLTFGPPNWRYLNDRVTAWTEKKVKENRPLDLYRDTFIDWALEDGHAEVRYSAFVQEWLFFGLLTEFLLACELPFDRADFIKDRENGEREVTTEALRDYILALVVQEELRQQDGTSNQRGLSLKDNDGDHRYGDYKKTQLSFRRSRWRMMACHEVIKTARDFIARDVRSRLDLVHSAVYDSVLLLMASLSRVVDSIYRPLAYNYEEWYFPIDFRNFRLRSILDVRDNDTWCPYERRVTAQLVDGRLQEIAFFSCLKREDSPGLHSECTDRECVLHQITDRYRTLHVNSDCQCEARSLDSQNLVLHVTRGQENNASFQLFASKVGFKDTTKLKAFASKIAVSSVGQAIGVDQKYDALTKTVAAIVVENNNIRTVTVPIGIPSQLRNQAEIPPSWNLVAISHVWSDGLGNPNANELPTCQLTRLQQLANKLFPDEALHPVPFWIDTLMIPITPKDAPEELRQRKRQALREMEWVYKKATKVLVLDSDLQALSSTALTPEELGANIMCSTWSRRLWTLQEGCRAEKTFFQLADRAVSRINLHQEILDTSTVKNVRHSSTVLREDHPIRQLQKLPWLDIHLRTFSGGMGKISAWDIWNRLEAMIAMGIGGTIGTVVFGPLGTPAVLAATFGIAMMDFTSPKYQSTKRLAKRLYKVVNPVWYSIFRFMEEMSLRKATSLIWKGDLNGGALAQCIRAMYYRNCTKAADESLVLASLLSSHPGLPATLTTVEDSQRMRTLFEQLKQVPVEVLFVDQRRYQESGSRWIPRSLLSVNAPTSKPVPRTEKIRTKAIFWSRKDSLIADVTSAGLAVGLDGLRVQPQPCILTAPFRFQIHDAFFRVALRHPGIEEEIISTEVADWVLIPELSFVALPLECQAILVKVREWYPLRPGGSTEFFCLATLTRMEFEDFAVSSLPCFDLRLNMRQNILTERLRAIPLEVVQKVSAATILSDDKWVVG